MEPNIQTNIHPLPQAANQQMSATRTLVLNSSVCKADDIKLRGLSAMLPHGGLPEAVSPYLVELIKRTGGINGPLGKQFIAQPEKEGRYSKIGMDPLNEDHHEIAPGVVYKYRGKLDRNGNVAHFGRVLWTVTRLCATYCRFCTRGREIGLPPHVKSRSKATIANKFFLSDEELETVFKFLESHKEINEVILSGGDPLTAPQPYLTKIITRLAELQQKGALDIVRVGTRLPVHNPLAIQDWHYELLGKLKNPYLMIHVNHPFELTEETLHVLSSFRKISLASVLSQTVLLRDVNDSVETLNMLFVKLAREGIRPYYVFQNDPVYWAKHFTVPFKRAIKLWGRLRAKLSGVAATARFVIDVPYGYGKVPVPEGAAWNVDYSHFYDFKKKMHLVK
jgi:lysine 2,3-aminomutase